jgi:hypothetical protein
MIAPNIQIAPEEEKHTDVSLRDNILRTLSYFSVFSYPLTSEQVHAFFPQAVGLDALCISLREMAAEKRIHHYAGYFQLNDDLQAIDRRLRGEELYLKRFSDALKSAHLIHRFPFVKSVSFSGGFSKGVSNKDSDVDFFIITQPGRLWICRTLLVLYKKVFRANSRRFFCVNYLISADSSCIPDKNLFTAVELSTLYNVTGPDCFGEFIWSNDWCKEYLPNHPGPKISGLKDPEKFFVSKIIEKLGRISIADRMDDFLMHLSLKTWKRKFPSLSSDEFNLNLRTLKTVSKHHPQGYQHKVLLGMDEIYSRHIRA